MNITPIKPGDMVTCDVKGRVFIATVEENKGKDGLRVTPLAKNITYFNVTARQVETWFKKMGRSNGSSGDDDIPVIADDGQPLEETTKRVNPFIEKARKAGKA